MHKLTALATAFLVFTSSASAQVLPGQEVECGNLDQFKGCKENVLGGVETVEDACAAEREGQPNSQIEWYTCLCTGHSKVLKCFEEHCSGSVDLFKFEQPTDTNCAVVPEEMRPNATETEAEEKPQETEVEDIGTAQPEESGSDEKTYITMSTVALLASVFAYLL